MDLEKEWCWKDEPLCGGGVRGVVGMDLEKEWCWKAGTRHLIAPS